MIYSITGKLVSKEEGNFIIETNGISYEILVPLTTFNEYNEIGKEITLFTKLIIKEDDISLIGFNRIEDKKLFDTLITVSGIGPKQALKIMSDLSTSEIRNAIVQGDERKLASIKGIGSKTASRIILELKDKIRKIQIDEDVGISNILDKKKMEVLMALRVLGYNDIEAKKAIEVVFTSNPNIKEKDVEDIIRVVLSSLANLK